MTADSATYLTTLHKQLNTAFNLAEIRTLCLNLNIDYESVAGEEKPSRIRELLLGLGRNGRLPELITLISQERPRLTWEAVPDDFQLPQSLASGNMTVPAESYHIYGDIVQGDKFSGDKIAGNKIETQTYIERQVIVQGIEISDLEQLPPELGEPPYKGLSYFTANDHEWFFGREKITAVLVNRLHDLSFLAVVGDSGSGKSSLVRAGVIPTMTRDVTLADGTVPPLGQWRVATLTPTARPLAKLATTLFPNDHAQQAILQEQATQNSHALHDALAAQSKPGHKLLLVVDQFEEIFTLCEKEEVRQAFINNLLTLAAESTDIKLIITLRADFYAQCLRYEGLRQLLKTSQEPLGAMSSQELA
ncbi:High-affnity carbon uptake protein Hat/HatR, partial [hydrothermal vent metagenome]